MKHKTWFRLVLKAIGILVIALSIREACILVWMLAWSYTQGQLTGVAPSGYLVGSGVGHLLSIAAGLYLLLGGEWLVNFCIPSNRRYCPDCGYDVSEPPDAKKCSECGATLPLDNVSGDTADGAKIPEQG